MNKVLITGATGFVGAKLCDALSRSGVPIVCATRAVTPAAKRRPDREWIRMDVGRPETLDPALKGCRAAFFLVHGMRDGDGFAEREAKAAVAFREAAARAGLERIIYLGGIAPAGPASEHLESRLRTGSLLREGSVPVFELRASMIIGAGGESWHIVRDLAVRLPLMILPRWLETRTEPIAIDDVVFALEQALTLPVALAGAYDIPGPETLSAKEIIFRTARLRGRRPRAIGVPLLSPRLSSYWLKLVTGADYPVARELVLGLACDLVSTGKPFWDVAPRTLTGFDDAARTALRAGDRRRSLPLTLLESALSRMAPRG